MIKNVTKETSWIFERVTIALYVKRNALAQSKKVMNCCKGYDDGKLTSQTQRLWSTVSVMMIIANEWDKGGASVQTETQTSEHVSLLSPAGR